MTQYWAFQSQKPSKLSGVEASTCCGGGSVRSIASNSALMMSYNSEYLWNASSNLNVLVLP